MTKNISLYSEVDILINGKPIKKYSHNGRIFVEAREGIEYTIRLKNNHWNRKLANVSVDGINVVNGEAAGKTEIGYVLHGFSSYEVKGFRTSNDTVNAFKFSSKKNSYAAKSDETQGDTSNCGVIGIKFFHEKTHNISFLNNNKIYPIFPTDDSTSLPYKPTWTVTCSDNSVFPSETHSPNTSRRIQVNSCSKNPPPVLKSFNFDAMVQDFDETPSFDLGTEFSDKEVNDKVKEVEFQTGDIESEFNIFYASRKSLIEMGVKIDKEAEVYFPTAFPAKFCKPPRK